MAKKPKPAGTGIAPAISLKTGADGQVGMTVSLDTLGPPSESFEADRIRVDLHRGAVRFTCQQEAGTAIEVRMPLESFRGFAKTLKADDFAAGFWKWAEKHREETPTVLEGTAHDRDVKPAVVARAQVARVLHAGSDAEISFYTIDLGGIVATLKNPTSAKPRIAAVVKITCHTLILAEAMKECLKLAAQESGGA